ncbi:MAG TPA: NADH-quinone oxidoreductase subunit N [Nitrospirota bacterium]
MNSADITSLSPFIILTVTSVIVMVAIAFHRSHTLTVALTLAGLALAAVSIPCASAVAPRQITSLFLIDRYALYYIGLILTASFAVSALSYSYLETQIGHHEEFSLLLLLATLGCIVLPAASHFATFFLGIEILSVSLYAMTAYLRHSNKSIEAGVKYLILAAVSSSFILFGMALIYAKTGSMEFREVALRVPGGAVHGLAFLTGTGMILVGLGFKLALVPFHLWTPDVYEGAPAPVTAFIATASKGAVFALVLRYFGMIDIHAYPSLLLIITAVAIASMFAGNLLALLQTNMKRILAYSSISHLGYLLVTVLATGEAAATAAAFYLTAYFITTLGAFGVVTALSRRDGDAESMREYEGLAWRRPWLAGVFTAMLFSLAGIPLTAGFVGKFYVVAAGAGSALWLAVIVLAINSVIGLFYYLRIVAALYTRSNEEAAPAGISCLDSAVLAGLTILLLAFGTYPGPLIDIIKNAMPF